MGAVLLCLFEAVDSALVRLQDLGKAVFVVCEDQLTLAEVIASGDAQILLFVAEGTQNKKLFTLCFAAIAVEGVAQGEMLLINTVADGLKALTQGNSLLVEVQNGVGVIFLLGSV